MGETTKIAWTDHTLNPVIGCSKVSPGCAHCYAETSPPVRGHRSRGLELWGPTADRWQTSRWVCDLRAWDRAAAREGVRRRVFIASLSDVFEDHPTWTDVRPWLFAALGCLTNTDAQLLTKRQANILRMVPPSWRTAWPAHVWIGTTVEDQARADERIPHLLAVPAAVRFLSVEPQLGPVDLSHYMPAWFCDACGAFMRGRGDDGCAVDEDEASPCCSKCGAANVRHEGISWVICGGESGPRARPFDLAWARSLRDQCRAAGVPFFLKQFGANAWHDPNDGEGRDRWRMCDSHGADESEWPTDLRGCRAFPVPQ